MHLGQSLLVPATSLPYTSARSGAGVRSVSSEDQSEFFFRLSPDRVLEAGPEAYGLLTSAVGIGAMASAILLATRRGPSGLER